jgi:D-alanyl-D-alanine dipeptidase
MVGRNGLGWGNGYHGTTPPDEPRKREGDGKAPAGVFRLSSAFGYDAPEAMTWVRLPYRQATSTLLCVDDKASRHYNRILDTKETATDWKSAEEMRRRDNQYRLGIVIDHNSDPIVPGDGSCIFLHIWAGPNRGTSGCTALTSENVEALLRWLDPKPNRFSLRCRN